MTEPIDLNELRRRAHEVQQAYDRGPGISNAPSAHLVAAWPAEVLALIDIAEAAHEMADAYDSVAVYPEGSVGLENADEALAQLRQALAKFTFSSSG